jgi:hypothetical protein
MDERSRTQFNIVGMGTDKQNFFSVKIHGILKSRGGITPPLLL